MAGCPISTMLTGGKTISNVKHYATEKEVASLLKITPYQVRRVVTAYKRGGLEATRALKWGAGRPRKPMKFTQEDFEYMVSRPTMYAQAGMSLKARAKEIS